MCASSGLFGLESQFTLLIFLLYFTPITISYDNSSHFGCCVDLYHSMDPTENRTLGTADRLIVVCCHAIYVGGPTNGQDALECKFNLIS